MTDFLYFDLEIRAKIDIKMAGLDNYCRKAEILMLGWAINDAKTQLWFPSNSLPIELSEAISNPKIIKVAWNTSFEHEIFSQVLKIEIPIEQCRDAAVLARSLSLPGGLAAVCEILKIDKDEAKIDDGKRLIELFCEPHFFKSIKSKKNIPGMVDDFYNETTHPDDWKLFCDYCIRDVDIERKLWLKFLPLSFPEEQWTDWFMDFNMNRRGMPVAVERAKKALDLASRYKKESRQMLNEITGLANSNSTDQLLPWLKSEGYPLNSVEKKYVEWELKNPNSKLTDKAREVLTLRRKSAQNSYKKLEKILAQTSPDGRLRNQFMFMGAARTGRWSAYGPQVMNMPRPIPAIKKMEPDEIFDLVDREAYDEILERFDNSTLPFVASIIRMMFQVS